MKNNTEFARVGLETEIKRDLSGNVLPSVSFMKVSVVPDGEHYGIQVSMHSNIEDGTKIGRLSPT